MSGEEYRIVISEILPRANIAAMRKALAASGRFVIEKTDCTLIVRLGNVEVLRAVAARNNLWIVRRANGLFVQDNVPDAIAEKISKKIVSLGGINKVSIGARIADEQE